MISWSDSTLLTLSMPNRLKIAEGDPTSGLL
jgi:hypothetical protein